MGCSQGPCMLSSRGSLTRLGDRGLPKEWHDQHPFGPACTDQRRAVSSCPASAGAGSWVRPRIRVLPFADLGALPQPWPPQSLPNCVSEPHPNSSRLCQGDWKFLPSSFSGRISTLALRGTGRSQAAPGSAFSRLCLGGMGGGLR